jgi:hypothetical protein
MDRWFYKNCIGLSDSCKGILENNPVIVEMASCGERNLVIRLSFDERLRVLIMVRERKKGEVLCS